METLEIVYNNEKITVILPQVGMVGTMFVGSDRYVVCCNTVFSNKKCGIVILYQLNERNVDKFIYKDNEGTEYLKSDAYNEFLPNNETIYYSLRKNGIWYPVGCKMQVGCHGVKFGFARPYQDPSF